MDNSCDLTPEINGAGDAIASSGAGHAVVEFIPDRYLNRAIGACCTDEYQRLLLPKPVKELIARYAPKDRPTMDAIPQERRRGSWTN